MIKLNRRKKLCLCGCGKFAGRGRSYIKGHKPKPISQLCECGCGKWTNPGNRFFSGHIPVWNKGLTKETNESIANASEKLKKPKPDPKPCECKCGGYAKPGKRFIHGHHTKGKQKSEQVRANMKMARNRPEVKAQISASQKIAQNRAEVKQRQKEAREKIDKEAMGVKMSASQLIAQNKPGVSERKSASLKIVNQNSEFVERRTESIKKTWSGFEIRNEQSERSKKAWSGDEIRNEQSERIKNIWKDQEYKERQLLSRCFKKSPNDLEFFSEKIIREFYPSVRFIGNFSYIVNGKCPDFVDEEQKKIIEIYGDYWHKDDDPEDRKEIFAQADWDCLVIWEHEIYEKLDNVLYKLKCFMDL